MRSSGNLPNVLRYFPIAAFNFAFKQSIEDMFPVFDPDGQFGLFLTVNLISGGLAGALSLTLVYPLDYCRTRLAADVGTDSASSLAGKLSPPPLRGHAGGRQFDGLWDCMYKTIRTNGVLALYAGYAISVVGIIAYRAPYFGLFDTFDALSPFKFGPGGTQIDSSSRPQTKASVFSLSAVRLAIFET